MTGPTRADKWLAAAAAGTPKTSQRRWAGANNRLEQSCLVVWPLAHSCMLTRLNILNVNYAVPEKDTWDGFPSSHACSGLISFSCLLRWVPVFSFYAHPQAWCGRWEWWIRVGWDSSASGHGCGQDWGISGMPRKADRFQKVLESFWSSKIPR